MTQTKLKAKLQDFILDEVFYHPTRWPGLSFQDIADAFCWAMFFMGEESARVGIPAPTKRKRKRKR